MMKRLKEATQKNLNGIQVLGNTQTDQWKSKIQYAKSFVNYSSNSYYKEKRLITPLDTGGSFLLRTDDQQSSVPVTTVVFSNKTMDNTALAYKKSKNIEIKSCITSIAGGFPN